MNSATTTITLKNIYAKKKGQGNKQIIEADQKQKQLRLSKHGNYQLIYTNWQSSVTSHHYCKQTLEMQNALPVSALPS